MRTRTVKPKPANTLTPMPSNLGSRAMREPSVSFAAMIQVLSANMQDRATERKIAIDVALTTFDDKVERQRCRVFRNTKQFLDDTLPLPKEQETAEWNWKKPT